MTRTGAPSVLLQFLQWLNKFHKEIKISLIALKEGDLKGDFLEVIEEYYPFAQNPNSRPSIFQRLERKISPLVSETGRHSSKKDKFLKKFHKSEFDIIYGNSISSFPLAQDIKSICTNAKLILHFHELDTYIKVSKPYLNLSLDQIDGVIAVSELVKDDVLRNFQVSSDIISVIYPFVKIMDSEPKKGRTTEFIVGGAGNIGWPKRADLFIQVAYSIKKNYPHAQIRFIWVGAMSKLDHLLIQKDLEKAGLKEMVFFIGEKINPLKEFATFDIFLLTSREEAFGLVGLEAGILSKPVICFKEVSGFSEVLEREGIMTIPYLDIEKMAETVMRYYNNRSAVETDGARIQKLCSEFSVGNQCPKLYSFLNSFFEIHI